MGDPFKIHLNTFDPECVHLLQWNKYISCNIDWAIIDNNSIIAYNL